MGDADIAFPLLRLPGPAWGTLVRALRSEQPGGGGAAGGALCALRATCRQLRAAANARTRHVSTWWLPWHRKKKTKQN